MHTLSEPYTCEKCGEPTYALFSETLITGDASWCRTCYIEGWRNVFSLYYWHLNNLNILEARLKILKEEVERRGFK